MKPIVDISFWQPNINYDVFATEISGAILRGTYGIWKDTKIDQHYEELHKRGVPLGCYHYIIGNQTGMAQADIFNRVVHGKEFKLGLWNDVEDRKPLTGLFPSVVNEYHANIELLTKRKVGIYTGQYAWFEIMGKDAYKYSDRPLWMSWPSVSPIQMPIGGKWTTWLLWQYTFKGKFEGVDGDIDCNRFNGTEEEYKKLFNIDMPTPQPEPEPPTNEVTLPTLKVISPVRVRELPNNYYNTAVFRMRQIGEIVTIEDIHVNGSGSVWAKDKDGWSAIVHAGWQYMA